MILFVGCSFIAENIPIQGRAKKVPAKFSDTGSVRADGLCNASPSLVGGRKMGNSNMQEFFSTTLYYFLSWPAALLPKSPFYAMQDFVMPSKPLW